MKKILSIIALVAPTLIWAQVDRSVRPEPAEAPQINIKKSEVFTTKNGMTVIISENHKAPKVSFSLVMGAEPKFEGSKAGLANLAGGMIMSGTSNRTKDVLDAETDYIGASLFADENSVYMSCLTKHMDKGLTLMSDVTMNAAFPQSEFDRITKQAESGLKSAKSDPSQMAGNAIQKSTYSSNHPYSEVMTEENLKNITRDDVIKFYKENYTPNGATMTIVGDIDRATAEAMANKYFGSWTGGQAYKNPNLTNKSLKGNNVFFVKKPGAVQSVIYVAFPVDIKPGNKDQIALTVLNNILGGGAFGNRLMQNLREDKAYTYGCRSGLDIDEHGSLFTAYGNFRNEVSDSAITQIQYEIERITEGYVEDDELNLTKSSMAGAFARSLENPSTVAKFARNIKKYNLPEDYYQTYLQKLSAVNKEDILNMAQKYFSPKNLNIVVVGSEEIKDKLVVFDSDGKIEMLDAFGNEAKEIRPADITADQLIEKHFLAMTVSDASKPVAKQMKKAQKKLKKLKSYKMVMDLTSPQVPIPLKMTNVWIAPNQEGQKLEGQGMVLQKSYFDGETSGTWSMQTGEAKDSPEEVAAKKKSTRSITEMNHKATGMKYELMGIEVIDGKEVYVMKINDGDHDSFSYYDKETFYKVRTMSTQTQGEETVTSEITYGDFKEQNGVIFANSMTIQAGPLTLSGKTKTLEINEKIDITLFQ